MTRRFALTAAVTVSADSSYWHPHRGHLAPWLDGRMLGAACRGQRGTSRGWLQPVGRWSACVEPRLAVPGAPGMRGARWLLLGRGRLWCLPRMCRRVEVQRFHFRARPRCLAQELERRVHARIVREASDLNAIAKAIPSVPPNEMLDHRFEGHAVQGIDGTRLSHWRGRRRELSVRMSMESSGVMHERMFACESGGTAPNEYVSPSTKPNTHSARKIGTKMR